MHNYSIMIYKIEPQCIDNINDRDPISNAASKAKNFFHNLVLIDGVIEGNGGCGSCKDLPGDWMFVFFSLIYNF